MFSIIKNLYSQTGQLFANMLLLKCIKKGSSMIGNAKSFGKIIVGNKKFNESTAYSNWFDPERRKKVVQNMRLIYGENDITDLKPYIEPESSK